MQLLGCPRNKPTRITLSLVEVQNFYPARPPTNLIPHYFPPSKHVPVLLDLGQPDHGPMVFTVTAVPVSFNVLPVRERTKNLWVALLTSMATLGGNDPVLRVLEIAHLVTVEAHAPVAIRLPNGAVILASDFSANDLISALVANQSR
jgi:hypothetical protein